MKLRIGIDKTTLDSLRPSNLEMKIVEFGRDNSGPYIMLSDSKPELPPKPQPVHKPIEKEELQKWFFHLLAEKLGLSLHKISLEKDLRNDLDVDSLDAVEIVMAVEDEYDIEIPDEDFERLRKVQEALDYLYKRLL